MKIYRINFSQLWNFPSVCCKKLETEMYFTQHLSLSGTVRQLLFCTTAN